jgi:dTDP-4-dehydrorhamnose reductase
MIIVTGASGLLGAAVVASSVQRNRKVLGLYRQHAVSLPGAQFSTFDLTNRAQVERVFEEFHPTAVIHCAAQTNVDWCQEHAEEARQVNVEASGVLAEIAVRHHAYLLYVSTDSVFDGVCGNYVETDPPAPLNVYAQTKREGELVVLAAHDSAGIARVTTYGWNVQNKQCLAEWILEQLRSGKTVPGFTDVFFCPIVANDLAEILLDMVDRRAAGIFHVVGTEAVSKYEFARRLAQAFSLDPANVIPSQIVEARLKAARPRNVSLKTDKISALLGRPMPDVNSGLRRFVQLPLEGYVERMRGQLTGVRE